MPFIIGYVKKPGLRRQTGFFFALQTGFVWLAFSLIIGVTQDCVSAQEFRTVDRRQKLDSDKLESCGLKIYESKRLILVTDVAPELVQELPALADKLFDELVNSLGPLRPSIDQKEFQVTGFLIDAKERFEQAGVLPPEEYSFRHGRHYDYQFWMNNQATDYYRRHLLLHEFVHCYMTADHGMLDIPPLWYTEGIAEYFATHQLGNDGAKTQFGVLPDSADGFEGWGRIATIHEALEKVAAGESFEQLSLEAVRHPPDNVFVSDLKYAQAWALVWLIRNHPELKQPFSSFSTVRSFGRFEAAEQSIDAEMWTQLAIQWPLFLHSLTEGFDTKGSWTPLKTLPKKPGAFPKSLSVDANHEWQTFELHLKRGQAVSIECTGRYVMHDQPKPWISEPQGITIDYWRGEPLGRIVGLVISDDGRQCSPLISIGVATKVSAPFDGELWLQINDSAASRLGNSGTAKVTIDGVKN